MKNAFLVTLGLTLLISADSWAQGKTRANKNKKRVPIQTVQPIEPMVKPPQAVEAKEEKVPIAVTPMPVENIGVEVEPKEEAGGEISLPGEREFNECMKIPPNRKVKVTLKPGSDLQDLVYWISTMTCKRFIVADNLRANKVTLISPTPVTALEAYRAFLSSLDVMGLTVAASGKYLKIIQGNWSIHSSVPTFVGQEGEKIPSSDQVITQIVRIQHVDVNEVLGVLNKMKSRSGDVTSYKPTNALIITDVAHNVKRLLRIIKELDAPTTGEKIWVVRLKYAEVEEAHKILTQLFAQQGRTPVVIP
ncbi:MAG: secretin N-terminal domain-containing protein, partial [Pseudomonadota bacterium]